MEDVNPAPRVAHYRSLAASLARWVVSPEGLTWLAVAAGVFLRVAEYSRGRDLYRDEGSLLINLVDYPVLDFTTRLTDHQLAPPVFLLIERLLVRLPIPVPYAGRLLPLFAGVASLFLMRAVAWRYLDRRAVPIAAWLFAVADDVVYYASEIKQYSSDMALTLAALLLASGAGASPRRRAALGAFGAAALWFSHPLVFVLAGVGCVLVADAAARRDRRALLAASGIGGAWVLSFAGCYAVSQRLLTTERFIWNWWDFAFLPIPPRSPEEARRVFWHVANVFVGPAYIRTPLGLTTSALLSLGLFVVGCASLAVRRGRESLALVVPLLAVLAASGLHKYPFHGRLLLFLVPILMLGVAQGAAAATRRTGWATTLALALLLVGQPAVDVFWYETIMTRHRPFDSHGDLHRDLLDEREELGP